MTTTATTTAPATAWSRDPGRASGQDLFVLPAGGCPMAHCDPAMTDQDPTDAVVVYDTAGKRLWASGNALSGSAWTSAPSISSDGEVIAADSGNVVRFRADGSVRWRTAITGGSPISPVVSPAGDVVLVATQGGPIHLLDPATGAPLASRTIRASSTDAGSFYTVNTPSFSGKRAYVAMQYRNASGANPTNLARLVALDIDPSRPRRIDRLTPAWQFTYGGPSGASPLLIGDRIYFDGAAPAPYPGAPSRSSMLFAVQDRSSSPSLLWAKPLPGKVAASPARDPRSGLWAFSTGTGDGRLLRFDEATGQVLQTIDLSTLTPGTPRFPSSALSIAGSTSAKPTMVLGTRNSPTLPATTQVSVVNIDLVTGQLVWSHVLPGATNPTAGLYGQFPVAGDATDPLVIVSGFGQGAMALGG